MLLISDALSGSCLCFPLFFSLPLHICPVSYDSLDGTAHGKWPSGRGRLPGLTVIITDISNLQWFPAMLVNAEAWTEAVAQLGSCMAQIGLEKNQATSAIS